MDINHLRRIFLERQDIYNKLEGSLKKELELSLGRTNIKYKLESRVKRIESVREKIQRLEQKKSGQVDLDEIADFCGFRIITYYEDDIDEIRKLISEEFQIIEDFDKKEETVEYNVFGYRSTHCQFTSKRPPDELKNFSAELQIRTILMDAWAKTEHQMAYKNKNDVPKALNRKFGQLSAILEIADQILNEIKVVRKKKEKQTIEQIQKHQIQNEEMNLDNLRIFLEKKFPQEGKALLKLENY